MMNLQALLRYFAAQQTGGGPAPQLIFGDHGTHARLGALQMQSHFQPILAADGSLYGHEALLRANNGQGRQIPPYLLFESQGEQQQVVLIDRLCRVMHSLNYVQQGGRQQLFLNVNGRHLLAIASGQHGVTFERLLACCGLKPSQVVLEIIESEIDDPGLLREAVSAYRACGFRIAIDDFGARHSNFDRLIALQPDIVKLDRSLTVQAMLQARIRKIYPSLIRLIHELDATLVCEGIETAEQASLAIDSGADLLQGYHLGRPQARLQSAANSEARSQLALA